jgi:hypothetical protein
MSLGRACLVALALAGLPAGAVPARAQEVETILEQMEWRASGVCVGADQCGACTATDAAADGILLRVTPPNGVSVEIPRDSKATAAALDFGSLSFTLRRTDAGKFESAGDDGNKIIQVMRNEPGLALRLLGDPVTTPFRYRLDEFPKAYAAILKACPGARAP